MSSRGETGVARPGIEEAVFSVFDLDRACAALVQAGGYERLPLPDCPAEQFEAWRVPPGCTRIEQALLTVGGELRGRIRVVAFHGVERELIRPSQRSWDTGGIFDLDMFSADVRAVYRRLQQDHGWTAFGEPVDYEMGDFDVTQVVAKGPDGLMLAIIEPHHTLDFDTGPIDPLSRVFNSTQMVRDLDAALEFYCSILGWQALVRLDIEDATEPGADVLGIPQPIAHGCKRRIAIVHPLGINDGSVELIQVEELEGRDYSSRAVAPNVGLLALRMAVEDPASYAEQIVARGGQIYAGPTRVDIAPFGPTDCVSVRTPDGAILEFVGRPG